MEVDIPTQTYLPTRQHSLIISFKWVYFIPRLADMYLVECPNCDISDLIEAV